MASKCGKTCVPCMCKVVGGGAGWKRMTGHCWPQLVCKESKEAGGMRQLLISSKNRYLSGRYLIPQVHKAKRKR